MTETVKIERRAAQAADERFDVVIVGAGIYGAVSALYAAARGLRTLLVERADFGAGTSFNSLRTVHGGLRYLQRLDLARARASSRQRDWWLRNFPDLVSPISCLMPLSGRGLKRPAAFRAAFGLTRLLGLNGAHDLPAPNRLEPPRLLAAREVLERAPAVPAAGLAGGALWSDAFMADSSRVLVETVRWAVGAGAEALNYTEAIGAHAEPSGDSRLWLLDRVAQEELTVTAGAVINAAGPYVDDVARRLGGRGGPILLPTVAWNMFLDVPAPSRCSLAVTPPRPGARTYFVHPYHGRVLAGTGHAASEGGEGPSESVVRAMRRDLEEALPGAGLGDARVLRTLAGILPGARRGSDQLALRPRVVRDTAAGGATLWNVLGVKLTEAPEVARKVVDAITGNSARHGERLPTRPAPASGWNVLPGAPAPSRAELLELAASESALFLDDLIERRTNAWCDDNARRRLEALLGGDFDRRAA